MTYNIGRGNVNLDTIAEVIAQENPDIVGINEIFGGGGIYGDQVTSLRNKIQTRLGGTWYSAFGKNTYFFLEGDYGNAVISRYAITSSYNRLLTREPSSNEQRGCLRTKIKVAGSDFWFYVTHLANGATNSTERKISAEEILTFMGEHTGVKVLAGDFNESYTWPAVTRIKQYMRDAWKVYTGSDSGGYTLSNPNPNARFDYIFIPQPVTFTVTTCYVPNYGSATSASDHRPVVVSFVLKNEPIRLWEPFGNDFYYTTATSDKYSGNKSIFLYSTSTTSNNGIKSQRFAVSSLATYVCSVRAKWANVSTGQVQVQVRSYDDKLDAPTYYGALTILTTGSSNNNWVLLHGEYQVPAGAKTMEVQLSLVNANNGAYSMFDDISCGLKIGYGT
ncbi:MAG: endonuclease/exonuclease/phosphatase family protein [bacterium]|nr:endonuclease/exonuclease/phosphatase family protein [bacterium]